MPLCRSVLVAIHLQTFAFCVMKTDATANCRHRSPDDATSPQILGRRTHVIFFPASGPVVHSSFMDLYRGFFVCDQRGAEGRNSFVSQSHPVRFTKSNKNTAFRTVRRHFLLCREKSFRCHNEMISPSDSMKNSTAGLRWARRILIRS